MNYMDYMQDPRMHIVTEPPTSNFTAKVAVLLALFVATCAFAQASSLVWSMLFLNSN